MWKIIYFSVNHSNCKHFKIKSLLQEGMAKCVVTVQYCTTGNVMIQSVIIRYWHFSLDPQANCILMKQHRLYLHTCINDELHSQIREEQSGRDWKESKKKETSLCRFSTRQKKVKITRKDDCFRLNPINSITRTESINSKKDKDNHAHKNKYDIINCITLNTIPQIDIDMTMQDRFKVGHQNTRGLKDKLNEFNYFNTETSHIVCLLELHLK